MAQIITAYVTDKTLPQVTEADTRMLTHVNIAFALIKDNRIVYDHLENTKIISQLRKYNPRLKILLSVGGWGADGFSQAASTASGREVFALSCAQAVKALCLDGIDLDWEYPTISAAGIEASPADKENFTTLLSTVRAALNAYTAPGTLLTIAAGAGTYYLYGTQMSIAQQYLDYVLLMTYDLRGGFQILSGHHTNLYTSTGDLYLISADSAVGSFIEAHVPRQKNNHWCCFFNATPLDRCSKSLQRFIPNSC